MMIVVRMVADEPVAVLDAPRGERLNADPEDSTPSHVIRTGQEVLTWILPTDLPFGAYRVEMSVRTGNSDSNPLNLTDAYRFWSQDGSEESALTFDVKPGEPPQRTPGKWPHHMGKIEGLQAVTLAGGQRVFATSRRQWSEVREIRILPAREEDLLSLSLATPRQWHTYRLGERMKVQIGVNSFLPEPTTLAGRLILLWHDNTEIASQDVRIDVPAKGEAKVEVEFQAPLNGMYIATFKTEWRNHVYSDELALSVVSVTSAVDLPDNSPFGVHSALLDDMYQTGFKWIRLWDTGDNWNRHEQKGKGQFDFSRTSAKVDRFIGQGFLVLGVLAYTPTWASTRPDEPHYSGAGAQYPPKDIADWRDYCREYMTRFRGRIRHFEVWNEPNAGFFKGTVAEYVALLKEAYEVAREVGPEIRILGGSGTGDFLSWTQDILEEGAGKYMDILSFHAYTTPAAPEEANLEGRLRQLRELAANHGVGHLPIWNTEVGYWNDRRTGVRPATAEELLAKAPENLTPNWQPNWPYRPIPEDDAAAFTVRHYYLNVAGGIEKVFWYSSLISGLPLLCRDSSPRLAALAIASAAEQLAGMEYWKRVDLGLSRLHLHLWRRGKTVKGILWYADRGGRGVSFPPLGQGGIFDIWGNPVVVAEGQELLLESGRDPLTIVANADFFSVAKVDMKELLLPVTECFVAHETDPESPVKDHTSPLHHGPRKVYGLTEAGDAIGWRIPNIRSSHYEILIELCTGSEDDLYGSLSSYEFSHRRGGLVESLDLEPAEDEELKPQPVGTPEGQGRVYGHARVPGSIWLEPGDELVIARRGKWGFVGGLILRETGVVRRVFSMPVMDETPVLDGDLSELEGITPWLLNSRRQVAVGVADPFASTAEKDAWGGPEDLSAEFVAARGSGWLYVGVRVTDPGELQPAPLSKGPWGGDCIELFLDIREDAEVGLETKGPEVYQMFLRAPDSGTAPVLEGRFPEGASAIAKPAENGWQAEFLIPIDWEKRRVIGLDLAVDDDDDDDGIGRKAQIVWHGSADNFQDPSLYARFKLNEAVKSQK
ncbi:MAG: hypothetical protein JW808_01385 [Victivallales bacterium]|nr:hypothetical protein [Victivallales bacterium]